MDPQKYIYIFIFFTIITGFGYIFGRNILREKKLINLIPFSVYLGSSLFVTLLHILSLIMGIKISTFLSLFLIICITFFILSRFKGHETLELGLPKTQFFLLTLFSFSFGILFLAYLTKFSTYDLGLYQLIGLITKQGYPFSNPFGPDSAYIYHNGVALFASGLKIFSKLDVLESLTPIQSLFIFILPATIFVLIYSITKNFLQSMLGVLIGCFCSNLRALSLFTIFLPDTFKSFITDPHLMMFWMADSGFVSPTQKALISPNSSIALPLSVFLFYICTKKGESITKKHYLPILLVSAFLFSAYEAYWVPVVLVILIFHAAVILNSKLNTRQKISSGILIILLLMTPFSTSGVLKNKSENITKLVSLDIKPYTLSLGGTLQFTYPKEWLKRNEIICHANGNFFYKIPMLSRYFFEEFGLPLLGLPLITFWILATKNFNLLYFLIAGIISFAIPFLVTYNIIEVETHRFLIHARFIFSILFGVFLGSLLNARLPSLTVNTFNRTFISLLIITLVMPGISWALPKFKSEYEYRALKVLKGEKKALNWLSKNAKKGDRGIGPWDIPFSSFELISIGGVYGTGAYIQNLANEETRATALKTLNPCLLKELKVKWLYLNKNLDNYANAVIPQDITNLLDIVPKNTLNQLTKEKTLVRRYKYKDNEELRLIYEFIPPENDKYCNNKNYSWSIGRLQYGKFIPIKSKNKTIFATKEIALKKLKELIFSLRNKEAVLYGVEAIKI